MTHVHKYSTKSIETRLRNDRIRRLRGLYVNANHLLDNYLADTVKSVIDAQLRNLGAQTHTEREREEIQAMHDGGYYKGYGKRRKFVKYEDVK